MKTISKNAAFKPYPRDDVELVLPDGKIISGKKGARLEDFLSILEDWDGAPIVGGIVDGELRELSYTVIRDATVIPINMKSSDGSKIYRRSLTFLLETAFHEMYPDLMLAIDHSVPNGGYYCRVINGAQLGEKEVQLLENHMRELVTIDAPIFKERVPLENAIKYFQEKLYIDKLNLLAYRTKPYLVLYQLRGHRDYHHGYMIPSTGYLPTFALIPKDEGFILQYPRRKTPKQLFPMPQNSKLIDIFKQYGSWLESLEIDSVASLNDAIRGNSIREIILVSEALHEQKISQIATKIFEKIKDIRVVLIAGPTSSGKTTFSKRLAIQLLTHGISPYALEMDNYFVDREKTPRDEYGKPNFESFDAIDSALLENTIKKLMRGEEAEIPRFNFKTGKREEGEPILLGENQIILLEGIHGLNPQLFSRVEPENTFRIYVSCLTQLNLDHYNRISTTDSRLLRRIIRDSRTRGFDTARTINMWDSVRRGEREYIFPYQENADEIFNSALVYELSAIKMHAVPLLRQIPHGTSEYLEAKRLLAFLEWFLPIDEKLIPDNSIIREFIGGSILKEFNLWRNSPIQE